MLDLRVLDNPCTGEMMAVVESQLAWLGIGFRHLVTHLAIGLQGVRYYEFGYAK